jgi:TRAP-type mannitol/chloroaromatic compound transport system substrate-binding protein
MVAPMNLGPMFFIVPTGSDIRTVEDLRGKRIGTSSLKEGTAVMSKAILVAHGLHYPGDYEFALVGAHPQRWAHLQQGTIDGILGSLPVITAMRYYDTAKYVLETEHATITVMSAVSKVWYDKLPKELQAVIDEFAVKASNDIYPWTTDFNEKQRKVWLDNGGEIIALPKAQRDELMKLMLPIGGEVAGRKPAEKELFDLLLKAAEATA